MITGNQTEEERKGSLKRKTKIKVCTWDDYWHGWLPLWDPWRTRQSIRRLGYLAPGLYPYWGYRSDLVPRFQGGATSPQLLTVLFLCSPISNDTGQTRTAIRYCRSGHSDFLGLDLGGINDNILLSQICHLEEASSQTMRTIIHACRDPRLGGTNLLPTASTNFLAMWVSHVEADFQSQLGVSFLPT
jgi:hypothetical protein